MTTEYKLVEGTDFDPMGAEVYKDEYIRVVASGGIPIYTGVGYCGDAFSCSTSADAICGPEGGLRTYDAVYRDILKEKMLENLTAENRKRFGKSFLNKPPLDTYNMKNFSEKIGTNEMDDYVWAETNKEATAEARLNARLKMSDLVRQKRIFNDPKYASHIYFRAPSSWPHVEDSEKITLRENLKGCFLPDYHMNDPYSKLFAGAEPMTMAEHVVIINVDPNESYVFSSDSRMSDVLGEVIYGAKMTLSEYLIKLRKCGVGFLQPEMELYVTPPSGFFPSSNFHSCISNPRKTPLTQIDLATGERGVLEDLVRSQQLSQLCKNAFENYIVRRKVITKVVDQSSHIFDYKRWVAQNTPSDASGLFRDLVNSIQKFLVDKGPTIERIKSKIYSYYYLALGVCHPELIAEIMKENEKFTLNGEIDGFFALTKQELLRDFNESMLEYKPKFIIKGKDMITSAKYKEMLDTTILRLENLSRVAKKGTLEGETLPIILDNVVHRTNIGEFITKLPEFGRKLTTLPAFSLKPAPEWSPPSDAKSSIEIASIKVEEVVATTLKKTIAKKTKNVTAKKTAADNSVAGAGAGAGAAAKAATRRNTAGGARRVRKTRRRIRKH